MLDKVVNRIVTDSLNWFFETNLKDHYDKRREALSESSEQIIPVIDYILQTCTGNKDAKYPPDSGAKWIEYYTKMNLDKHNYFLKRLLLVYLELDIRNYTSSGKECSTVKMTNERTVLTLPKTHSLDGIWVQLHSLPHAFDFPSSTVYLATGLWAVDNGETDLVFASLSNPSVKLQDYFVFTKEVSNIIISSIFIDNQSRIALFMSKIHRYESWDENFDPIYALLLLRSNQLSEALKYERIFSERENYEDILEKFFRFCLESNVMKYLNCLNLSAEEEEVLNQLPASIEGSRPVTPASGKHLSSISQSSRQKPTNRNIKVIRRTPSFNDSPARNTRLARKRKPNK